MFLTKVYDLTERLKKTDLPNDAVVVQELTQFAFTSIISIDDIFESIKGDSPVSALKSAKYETRKFKLKWGINVAFVRAALSMAMQVSDRAEQIQYYVKALKCLFEGGKLFNKFEFADMDSLDLKVIHSEFEEATKLIFSPSNKSSCQLSDVMEDFAFIHQSVDHSFFKDFKRNSPMGSIESLLKVVALMIS